ncbi:YqhG family protein [Alicyclobacillus fastidiosus]|uniref:YqhG family protein n=1 Tax=Alicyclobacillus fastidiosus TaxID=392011 RepID=A0ABV5AFZ6_9BACL|nr:YqhG family protein [Alicyclobacillus fastidiosus]WEH11698.1 YqhG family protein [Alicyclobacillus fastidiosus]
MPTSVPLREEGERMSFCETYFDAVDAQVVYQTEGYREIRLPLDVDKELTDRPFFWLWAEKTKQKVEPTTLRLAFTEEAKRREDARLAEEHRLHLEKNPPQNPYELMFAKAPTTELITLGCFRMNKIVDSAINRGRFACVQPIHTAPSDILVPWLVLNALIQFVTDSVEEKWMSIGVCLANRQPVFDFYDKIAGITMKTVPANAILKHASLSVADGMAFAKSCIRQHIDTLPVDWAEEAVQRLEDDLSQLDTYYKSILPDHDEATQQDLIQEHKRKRAHLVTKSAPRTEVQITQAALVGLPVRNRT